MLLSWEQELWSQLLGRHPWLSCYPVRGCALTIETGGACLGLEMVQQDVVSEEAPLFASTLPLGNQSCFPTVLARAS